MCEHTLTFLPNNLLIFQTGHFAYGHLQKDFQLWELIMNNRVWVRIYLFRANYKGKEGKKKENCKLSEDCLSQNL